MEALFAELERLTQDAANRLDEMQPEQLLDLVVQREAILTRLRAAGTPAPGLIDPERLGKLLDLDRRILDKMERCRQEASKRLRGIKDTRKLRAAYRKVYALDAVFFEKKIK